MVLHFRSIAVPIVALLFASTGRAQDATTAVVIAPMDCTKPAAPTRSQPSAAETKAFQKNIDDYKTCVTTYANANRDKANDLAEQTKQLAARSKELTVQYQAYADVANRTVDDFNAYVTDLNAKNSKK